MDIFLLFDNVFVIRADGVTFHQTIIGLFLYLVIIYNLVLKYRLIKLFL